VLTPEWRYTEWVNLTLPDTDDQAPDWNSPVDWGELYSLQQDPHETVNLYRDQGYHDTKIELRKVLHGGWSPHND